MSAPALMKLIIEHLRGSVASFELPFEKGKKLTVVYGENGTGKSTICDALEFLGKGKVGSLDNRGLGRTSRFWNTVSKTSADITVTLETAGGSCHGRMVKDNVVVDPPEARPRVEALRRSQILDLLEAQPGERYAAISRFIDVSSIETSENALRRLISEESRNRDLAAAGILENRRTLEQFWEAAGHPGTNALDWATTESQRDPLASEPELLALRALQAAYARLFDHRDRLPVAAQTVLAAREFAAAAQQRAEESSQAIVEGAPELVVILTSARDYLQNHPDDAVCPLCGSAAAVQDLPMRIAERLGAFTSLQQAQAASKDAQTTLQRAEQAQELLNAQVQQDAASFEQACADYPWSADIPLPTASAPQDLASLADWLAATAELPDQWGLAEAARQDQQQFLTALKSALQTYNENMEGQQELDVLLPNLQRTLEIVEEERKAFLDDLLKTIAAEVGRMYEEVHPGEGLNQISLGLDSSKRASLEIGTSFGGLTGRPPQAYLSQAHLDTLGLCVFLALATLDDPANTILVLDDVLASVDEPHTDRLILMLYTEVAKFRHCIITTHYGPWKHKFRWGWLKNGQCHFIELSRWTLADGMTVIRSVPDIEKLKELLTDSSPDPQLICAKAGVVLEAALDFLTLLYECSVPRKHEARYTLGELLPAINKKLRTALRVEVLTGIDAAGAKQYQEISLTTVLSELDRVAQTRNVVGCHFNAIAFDLLEGDALYFGQLVMQLIEALADPDAGWPRNSKSGTYWANAGETRRLYPLKQPS